MRRIPYTLILEETRSKEAQISIFILDSSPTVVPNAYRLFNKARTEAALPDVHVQIEPADDLNVQPGCNVFLLLKARSEAYRQIQFQEFMTRMTAALDDCTWADPTEEVHICLITQTEKPHAMQEFYQRFYALGQVSLKDKKVTGLDKMLDDLVGKENSSVAELVSTERVKELGHPEIQPRTSGCHTRVLYTLNKFRLGQNITEDLRQLEADTNEAPVVVATPASALKALIDVKPIDPLVEIIKEQVVFPLLLLTEHGAGDLTAPRLLLYQGDWLDDSTPGVANSDWEDLIASEFGEQRGVLVVRVNAAEMISEYVGETERNLRSWFRWQRGLKAVGTSREIRSVILSLEAIDVIGVSDEDDQLARLYSRCVTTLLLCLDGLGDASLLPTAVVAKSSKPPSRLDQRLLRPGRLYKHIRLL